MNYVHIFTLSIASVTTPSKSAESSLLVLCIPCAQQNLQNHIYVVSPAYIYTHIYRCLTFIYKSFIHIQNGIVSFMSAHLGKIISVYIHVYVGVDT